MFLMWIGEQITSRGIGNGVSLIIMAGIVARLPHGVGQLFEGGRTGSISAAAGRRHHRRSAIGSDPVHLLHGARAAPGADPVSQAPDARAACSRSVSHLPLKLNTAGVIPPIFASSLLLMPLTITQLAGNAHGTESGASDWLITISTYLQHGRAALHGALRRRHRLLLLLLHRGACSTARRPPRI